MVWSFHFLDIVRVLFYEKKITHAICRVFFLIFLSFLRDFGNPYLLCGNHFCLKRKILEAILIESNIELAPKGFYY